jgi:hypothetical protein
LYPDGYKRIETGQLKQVTHGIRFFKRDGLDRCLLRHFLRFSLVIRSEDYSGITVRQKGGRREIRVAVKERCYWAMDALVQASTGKALISIEK